MFLYGYNRFLFDYVLCILHVNLRSSNIKQHLSGEVSYNISDAYCPIERLQQAKYSGFGYLDGNLFNLGILCMKNISVKY